MDDNSLMPFGEHKGEKLGNIPAEYFIWLHKNNRCYGQLKKYIEDNFDVKITPKK